MKEIKIQDVYNLQKEFLDYCDRAEQYAIPFLAFTTILLECTLKDIEKRIEDQKEMRAMFRSIYKIMGKDYSQYIE